MSSTEQHSDTLSLQEIIKRRNLQINQELHISEAAHRSPIVFMSTQTAGRKLDLSQEQEIEEQEDDGSVGVLSIIANILEKMDGFYKWSQQQAKTISWVAIGSCIAGALIIFAAFVLANCNCKLDTHGRVKASLSWA